MKELTVKALRWAFSTTTLQRARMFTTIIMLLAAAVSYGHQRHLLLEKGELDTFSALVVPLTVDFLAITCNTILHYSGVTRYGWWVSLGGLVITVGVSGVANFMAGGTAIGRLANLWTVLAYLIAEFVTASAKVKAREKDPKRVEAGHKAAATRTRKSANGGTGTRRPRKARAPKTVPDMSKLPEAPVSPAAPTLFE